VFESFKPSVTLNTIFRQAVKILHNVVFREHYSGCEHTLPIQQTLTLLHSFWDVLPPEEKADFVMSFMLLPTWVSVLDFNCQRLVLVLSLSCGVVQKHNHKEAQNVKSDNAEGLRRDFTWQRGKGELLTCNLWTSKGLVNGAQVL